MSYIRIRHPLFTPFYFMCILAFDNDRNIELSRSNSGRLVRGIKMSSWESWTGKFAAHIIQTSFSGWFIGSYNQGTGERRNQREIPILLAEGNSYIPTIDAI